MRSDSSSKYTLVSIYSLNGLYKDLKLGRLYCSNQFFVWPATCINAFFSVDSTSSSKLSMNLDYIPHLRKVLTRPLMTQVHGSCVMLSCVNDIYDHVLMLHTDMCNVRITCSGIRIQTCLKTETCQYVHRCRLFELNLFLEIHFFYILKWSRNTYF